MKFLFLSMLISSSLSVLAQNPSGCIIVFPYGAVAAYQGVYPTALGISVPSGQSADIVGKPAYSNSGGIPVSYSCYKNPNPTSTRECAVRVPSGSSYIWYGGVFAQRYYQCPIDDSSLILILSATILGGMILRRSLIPI